MELQDHISKMVDEIKLQGYKSICFWLPVKSVGGGTLMFFQFAQYILDTTDLDVYYVDYVDGWAHSLFSPDSRIKFISYVPKAVSLPILEPIVVITSLTRAIQIKNINPKSKILLWQWETNPSAWDVLFLQGEKYKYMQLAKRENAIIFHDWGARDQLQRQFQTTYEKRYLPVVLEPKANPREHQLVNPNEINIAWLGRLSPDKVNSLYNLIDNLEQLEINAIKKLHVIGNGPFYKKVEEYCRFNAASVEVLMVGTLLKKRSEDDSSDKECSSESDMAEDHLVYTLDEYLLTQVDVLFAMGTSLLEGAALSIPSVEILLDNKRFDDNSFVWLFDAIEYCLGITKEQKNAYEARFYNLKEIVDQICEEGAIKRLGKQCYQHYINHHGDLEKNISNLLTFVRDTTLTFDQHKKCLKYVPYNILSLTELKSLHIDIWKIIYFDNHTYYKLFGLTLLEIVSKSGHISYRPFGIRPILHKYKKSGYVFHSEKYKG